MKKNIITISGELASGKGTVSKLLSQELGYEIYRNGAYVRKLAKDKGLDITSFGEYLANHPEVDEQVEKSAKEYADTHNNLIIDARLGWYVVPMSFKVYLKVDLEVSAKRALADETRKDTENFRTLEEQKNDIEKRYKQENDRFFKLYGIHKEDLSNYDLVIDTTKMTPEEVKQEILTKYKKWLEE